MKKATEAWFQSAESDLLLIDEILANENLTHLSAFHAQQAIEKSFKAIQASFKPVALSQSRHVGTLAILN